MHLKILLYPSGKDWHALRLKGEIEICNHDNIAVGWSAATGSAGSAHLVSPLPTTLSKGTEALGGNAHYQLYSSGVFSD